MTQDEIRKYGSGHRRGVVFALALFLCLGIAAAAQAAEYGIVSETYLYTGEHPNGSDGLRLDTDSKLQWWNNISTVDDFADAAEGRKSLKATIPASGVWFGMGIIWDPNQDGTPDTKNMSVYSGGLLKFWLKTETSVKVGIKDAAGTERWVAIAVPNDNQWRFVSLPMSNFSGINFANITQLFMISQDTLPAAANKTFHLDNIRWDSMAPPATRGLDHITITPLTSPTSPWTIPTGLPKLFKAQGYEMNNATFDVNPTWTKSVISGNFSSFNPFNPSWYVMLFTPSAAGAGTISAASGGKTGSASVTAANVTWNDFFNIFIDEGLYGTLGAYSAGAGNAITFQAVTDVHPPGRQKSLKAAYSITANGWAGVFFQEGENAVINPAMEQGTTTPTGWVTSNNTLTNETGWVTETYVSASHSIKILNIAVSAGEWRGQDITFVSPYPTKMRFSGWSKAANVSAGSTYALDFNVKFTDATEVWYYAPLRFVTGTHDWQFVQDVHDFGKTIKSVTPYCILTSGTGTAWFDDVYAAPEPPGTRDITGFTQGYLHFWVKTPVDLKVGVRTSNIAEGTEQSFVYLSDYSVPADNNWREVYIALDDLKQLDSRINYAQSLVFFNAAVVGEKVGASSGQFWLADVKYIRQKAGAPALTVELRRRDNGQIEPTGQFSWSTAVMGGGWEIADQYLSVAYNNASPSWGVQIWTDNMGVTMTANPRYTGSPGTELEQQPAGLIGEINTLVSCPMAWLVLDSVDVNVPKPVEKPNSYPKNDPRYKIFFGSDTNGMWGTQKAQGEWSWLKDISTTRWESDTNGNHAPDPSEIVSDFSLMGDSYSTFLTPAGIATGWFTADGLSRIYILNPKSPVAIYLAANFQKARELQKYRSNTITLELYHY